MSYTTVEQIRHHLSCQFPVADRVYDQRVRMSGTDYSKFFFGAVEAETFKVKSPQVGDPSRVSLSLSESATTIDSRPLMPGSVVVASDSSLGTVYVENVDYAIDYCEGTIKVKPGGSLTAGMDITAWYMPFEVYQEGVDYRIQTERGEIARLAGGAIAEGETVLLDYAPVNVSFDEDMLGASVRSANGLVEREVDPDREFGTDPVLAMAATYRALEIVSRSAAARELASLRGQDRVASNWMKLAEDYRTMADKLLKGFHPPCPRPASPSAR